MRRMLPLSLLFLFSTIAELSAQNRIPLKLVGTWESLQFKAAKEDSLDEKIAYGLSPQMITLDSSGSCFIQMMFEKFPWEGKIAEVKNYNYDSEFLLKYTSGRDYVLIETIRNNPDYIFLTFKGRLTLAIPFKRYRR